ncbi:unnamed protein product [Linum tenue]|uniref:Uncharacterized protein n=1 Tax=Linum tenue TaxID=586396 RepID=A0AAV0JQ70_9ROSI|nr:unnamed protein product [Linum tenue]
MWAGGILDRLVVNAAWVHSWYSIRHLCPCGIAAAAAEKRLKEKEIWGVLGSCLRFHSMFWCNLGCCCRGFGVSYYFSIILYG